MCAAPKVTVTSLHPHRPSRLTVFSLKHNLLSDKASCRNLLAIGILATRNSHIRARIAPNVLITCHIYRQQRRCSQKQPLRELPCKGSLGSGRSVRNEIIPRIYHLQQCSDVGKDWPGPLDAPPERRIECQFQNQSFACKINHPSGTSTAF